MLVGEYILLLIATMWSGGLLSRECSLVEFQCNVGNPRCVSLDNICDDVNHCSDGSDERICQANRSFAMMWTSSYTTGQSVIMQLYGDPEINLPLFARNPSNTWSYSLSYVTPKDVTSRYRTIVVESRTKQLFLSDSATPDVFSISNAVDSNATNTDSSTMSTAFPVSTQINGLAVDWLSRNLYWSDATNKQICMVELTNRLYWRPVIQTDLSSVQDIVVHANLRFLFWSDVGPNPKIERSDLTGDNRTVLANNSDSTRMMHPAKLAVDLEYGRICWLDTEELLFGCTEIYGSYVVTFEIIKRMHALSSFALYKTYVYFGAAATPNIYIFRMESGFNLKEITTLTASTRDGSLTGVVDMTMFSPSSQPTGASVCSNDNGRCAHICITTNDSTRVCRCSVGYVLHEDGTSCLTRTLSSNFLLLTDSSQRMIYQVNLSTGEVHVVSYTASSIPTAMDYDPVEKNIYWLDVSFKRRIWKTSLLSSGTKALVYSSNTIINSFSMDVYSRRMYYTSSARGLIVELTLDGTTIRTLWSNSTSKPTAIAVDGINRILFFSECASLSIRTIDLDNIFNMKIIHTGLSHCATALTVDPSVQEMYFGDPHGNILQSNYSGTPRRFVYQSTSSNITGLSIDSDYLYIADQNSNFISRMNRKTHVLTRLTSVTFVRPFSVTVPSYMPVSYATIPTTTTTLASSPPTVHPTTASPTADATSTSVFTTTAVESKMPPSKAGIDHTTSIGAPDDILTPSIPTTAKSLPLTPTSTIRTIDIQTEASKTNVANPDDKSTFFILLVVVVVVAGVVIVAIVVTVGVVIVCKKRRSNDYEHPVSGTVYYAPGHPIYSTIGQDANSIYSSIDYSRPKYDVPIIYSDCNTSPQPAPSALGCGATIYEGYELPD